MTREPRLSVLMVTGAYFPEISGGGLQCRTMIRALEDRIDFQVLTTCTDPSLPTSDSVEGTPVTRLYVEVSRRATKLAAAWKTVRFFFARGRSFRIVHLHGFSQKSVLIVLLSRLTGKRVLITLHTAGQDGPSDIRRLGWLAYWAYARADRYIAISAALADSVRREPTLAPRLREAPNGVDAARFRPAEPGERDSLCRELGLATDVRWIMFVGFFSQDKCPDVLFDAWLRVHEARPGATGLIFVGATESPYHEVDPSLAARIRAEAATRGVSHLVHFASQVPDIERIYRASDVFVMPSVREAFGMALVEAMASGLPCVATRIAGVTDAIVVDGRTGLLTPPRDTVVLAQAIQSLLADPDRAAEMGDRARAAVEAKYGLSASAARWFSIYREAIVDSPLA